MSTFFTSDLHLGHANIIRYVGRPFKDVYEMNETIINNWNSIVTPKDEVYHMGDFAFGNASIYLNQLNGAKWFVRGNHEKPLIQAVGERNVPFIRELRYGDQTIILCHYGMRVWNKSHFNSWLLYGHSHGTLEPQGKSIDVGIDTCHLKTHKPYTPYTLDEIVEIMGNQPDNFNYLKRLKGYDDVEFEKARYSREE